MSALSAMRDLASALAEQGIVSIVPAPDDDPETTSIEAMDKIKHDASKAHMASICDARTTALLVANVDRYGTPNYVGPNAFGEIAVAFATGRPIYLLQAMPEQYRSELRAWGARCLNGDLSQFVREMRGSEAFELV